MKKLFEILGVLISVLLFFEACSSNKEDLPVNDYSHKAYVDGFLFPDSISLEEYSSEHIYFYIYASSGCGQNDAASKTVFWKYATLYGDTTWNRDRHPEPIMCCTALKKIDITCDKSIDQSHPANSSLNDIVKIGATSYGDFIKNQYSIDYINTDFVKYISEMTANNYLFFEPSGAFFIPNKAGLSGDYTFTVSILTDENKLIQNKITIKY